MALHGAIAALLAFVVVLTVGTLPIGPRLTLADAAMISLIVFCVAAGHTAGIAAGSPMLGLAGGSVVGVGLAGCARAWLGRRT